MEPLKNPNRPNKDPSRGGRNAVSTGRKHERIIASILEDFKREHPELNISWVKLTRAYAKKIGLEQCYNIYGLNATPDFIVYNIPGYEKGLLIESKQQTVSGTGDEKFLYAFANARNYTYPTLFVITLEASKGETSGVQARFNKISEYFESVSDKMTHSKCPICGQPDEKSSKVVAIIKASQLGRWLDDQVLWAQQKRGQ